MAVSILSVHKDKETKKTAIGVIGFGGPAAGLTSLCLCVHVMFQLSIKKHTKIRDHRQLYKSIVNTWFARNQQMWIWLFSANSDVLYIFSVDIVGLGSGQSGVYRAGWTTQPFRFRLHFFFSLLLFAMNMNNIISVLAGGTNALIPAIFFPLPAWLFSFDVVVDFNSQIIDDNYRWDSGGGNQRKI